jgi:hypothetical protein
MTTNSNRWFLATFVTASVLIGCGVKDSSKTEGDGKGQAQQAPGEPKNETPVVPGNPGEVVRKGEGNEGSPKEPPKVLPPVAQVKPDVTMTAEELQTEIDKDWNFVFTKHRGKVIEVSGAVDSVGGFTGQLILVGGKKLTDRIVCPMRDPEPWTKVFPGQSVILRVRVVDPFQWEIIEVKGPRPVEFTADELARQVSAKSDEMDMKFAKKHIIVSGVIEKVDMDEFGHTDVKLKTEKSEPVVSCRFVGMKGNDHLTKRNTSLKPGLKLKAVGPYSGTYLAPCELLELSK